MMSSAGREVGSLVSPRLEGEVVIPYGQCVGQTDQKALGCIVTKC